MHGVEESGAVERNQVLVDASASYINTCRTVACRCHAGQLLQGFQHVGLSEKRRNAADFCGGELNGAHLRGVDSEILTKPVHGQVGQPVVLLQAEPDGRASVGGERVGGIAGVSGGETIGNRTFGGERKFSPAVSSATFFRGNVENRRPDKRSAVFAVGHRSLQCQRFRL